MTPDEKPTEEQPEEQPAPVPGHVEEQPAPSRRRWPRPALEPVEIIGERGRSARGSIALNFTAILIEQA